MHTADDAGKNSGRTSEDQSCRQRCGVADIQHRSLNRDAEFGGQHRHTAEQNTDDPLFCPVVHLSESGLPLCQI